MNKPLRIANIGIRSIPFRAGSAGGDKVAFEYCKRLANKGFRVIAYNRVYNNEKEIGVTIQKLSGGLDCGEPVMEMKIPVNYKDTLHSLQKRIYEKSTALMLNALDFLETRPVLKKLDEYGKIYTLPNLRQWLFINIKILLRKLSLKPK